MKRDLDHEDLRLWAIVAHTVRPGHGKSLPPLLGRVDPSAAKDTGGEAGRPSAGARPPQSPVQAVARPVPQKGREIRGPEAIEPRRKHRIVHDREPIAARIDLHNMTFDVARAALSRFIQRAYDEGWRAVLVITGKGALGDGILRRHAPDWLAEAPIRTMVAGISEAHRRHGGEGALYVALKRKPRA